MIFLWFVFWWRFFYYIINVHIHIKEFNPFYLNLCDSTITMCTINDHFNVMIQKGMKNVTLPLISSLRISSIVSFELMLKANANTTPLSGLCSFLYQRAHVIFTTLPSLKYCDSSNTSHSSKIQPMCALGSYIN